MAEVNTQSIVTRCPKCGTAFRVTDNQLAIAKGAVRCGSCLNIFKATDHQLATTKPAKKAKTDVVQLSRAIKQKLAAKHGITPPETQPEQKTSSAKPAARVATTHKTRTPATKQSPTAQKNHKFDVVEEEKIQDKESDNNIEQNSDDFYFFDKEQTEAKSKTSIFGNPKIKPVTESSQEKADESWALDMLADLEDDEDIEPIQIRKQPQKQAPDIEEAVVKTSRSESTGKASANRIPDTDPIADDPISQMLAEDDNHDEDPARDTTSRQTTPLKKAGKLFGKLKFGNKKPSPKNKAVTETADDDLDFFYDESFDQQSQPDGLETAPHPSQDTTPANESPLDFIDEAEIEHIEAQPLISDADIDHAMNSSPSYKSEVQGFIDGIQGVPVEMEYYDSSQAGQWLWKLLVVLLVLIFCAQIIFFRFDDLGKSPAYRPYILSLCSKVGCTVPPLAEPEKVRASNLVVRDHPDIPGTLLVDVILINSSRSAQVYPTLLLEFSDINDSILTQNRITPSQYLRGELAGAKAMPSQQPVQISITLQDPGDAATNYRLQPIEDGV